MEEFERNFGTFLSEHKKWPTLSFMFTCMFVMHACTCRFYMHVILAMLAAGMHCILTFRHDACSIMTTCKHDALSFTVPYLVIHFHSHDFLDMHAHYQ